jgi:hypothetical protein
MIRKRLQHRPNWPDGTGYDPKLTLVVEGTSDVYRLARLLERGQVEFHVLALRILRGMDRQEPGIVHSLQSSMGPAVGGYRGKRRKLPQLRLGMPDAELQELEEAVR